MNDITVFDFEENAIRVIDRDGEPWFVAADVARVLDVQNIRQVLCDLDDDEAGVYNIYTRSENGVEQKREMRIVNESGLYNLIFRSRKPEAKKFRKWVTAEVLPSIRKTGMYVEPGVKSPVDDAEPVVDRAELSSLPDRTFTQWINLIRETRLLYGRAAARDVWAKSPLPEPSPVFCEGASAVGFDEQSGYDALNLILKSDTPAGVLSDLIARRDEQGMKRAGVRFYYRDGTEYLSIACVCFRRVCSGTIFDGNGLTRALLCLPGAFVQRGSVRFGKTVCHPVIVPVSVMMNKAA